MVVERTGLEDAQPTNIDAEMSKKAQILKFIVCKEIVDT